MWAVLVMSLACALSAPTGSKGEDAVPSAGVAQGGAGGPAGKQPTEDELGDPIVVPTPLGIIHSVAFSPNGRIVAVGGGTYPATWQTFSRGMALLLEVASGREIATLIKPSEALREKGEFEGVPSKSGSAGQTDSGPVWSVAFAPDGKTVATATEQGVKLWDAATGTEKGVVLGYAPGRGPVLSIPPCVTFSPNGLLLAASNLELWDVSQRRSRTKLQATSGGGVAFSPDDRFLASAEYGNRVHLWDVRSGRQLAEDHAMMGPLNAVAVSPDGKTLAAAGGGGAKLWELRTRADGLDLKLRPHVLAHGFFSPLFGLAFSPDGRLLATVGADLVKLWDVATAGELATLDRRASSVAFSPDGKMVAVGATYSPVRGQSASLRLYDLATAIRPEVLAKKARKAAADLIRESNNRTSSERLNALWSLGPHADSATAMLVEALGSSKVDVRTQLALALGLIGSPSARAALMKLLQDESSEVRGTAVRGLAICGQRSGDAVGLLLEAMNVAPPDTQKQIGMVLQGFVRRDDLETVHRVREAFRRAKARSSAESAQPSGVVRRGGQLLYDGRPVEEWIERLGRHYEPNEIFGRSGRAGPAAAVQAFGAAEAVPALIKALQDKRWAMRIGAADGLGMFAADAEPAIPALIRALSDNSGQVCELAADSLGTIHRATGRGTSAELLRLLDHPNVSVRLFAARAIAQIDPRREHAMAVLRVPLKEVVEGDAMSSDRRYEAAQTAMRALQSLGPKAAPAVPELVAILRTKDRSETNEDDYLRRAAAETLGHIGPAAKAAIPALVESLADPAMEVQAAAARTLPQISPDAVPAELVKALGQRAESRAVDWAFQGFGEKGVPALVAALGDPHRDVRRRAIGILYGLSAKATAALPSLKKATEDEDPVVRQEAIKALREIERSSRGQSLRSGEGKRPSSMPP